MKNAVLSVAIILISVTNVKTQFMEPNFLERDLEPYSASFVAEWAEDTASIETFTIVGKHLYGRAIHLYPEPHLRQFSYNFNPNGSIRTMDIQFYDLHNTSVPLQSKTGFLPYRITMQAGNEIVDFRVVDKHGEKQFIHLSKRMDFFGGWTPIFGQWQWLTDLLYFNELNEDLKFVNYVIGDYHMELTKNSEDLVVFDSDITTPITFYLDDHKKIEKIDGMGSPWNYIIKRTKPIDLEFYCKRFAKKKVIGDPSPHEKIEIEISDCTIEIDYGRPSKRGREIFGHVVPYGQVWRTGAGSPTRIKTSQDLTFQGITIPKGAYNLFTIPNKDSWELIFNTEKEAWGSAYRKEYDFANVPMTTEATSEEVEKFRIELIDLEQGKGLLRLMWDKTVASIRFNLID